MNKIKLSFGLLLTFIFYLSAICNAQLVFSDKEQNQYIGKYIWILKDTSGKMGIAEVKRNSNFEKSLKEVPNLEFTPATIWVKIQIKNNSTDSNLVLALEAPLIDEAELFTLNEDDTYSSVVIGQNKKFFERKYKHTAYLFDLHINKENERTYFIKIKSFDQIELPFKITTPVLAFSSGTTLNFMFGIYCGIMLIMICYNLFIYFSIRDKSYLYYVIYIVSVMLTQAAFQGYTFKYLWPDSPQFEVQSIMLLSIFVGVASVQFLRIFLHTTQYVPKLDKIFLLSYGLYAIAALLVVSGFYQISWQLILGIVSPLSLYMLFISFRIARMGYRPAKFFAIAWSCFLVGVFIHAMKSAGILPYNDFTVYTMPVGSAIETVLLSFALADRINILKEEKEESRIIALNALKENEKIITEQNIYLEANVKARTAQLEASNKDLKETQAQLVNTEKMASLGQLTAGIAHEINNPINFVISNVAPLKKDVGNILRVLDKYSEIKSDHDLHDKIKEINDLKEKLDVSYLITEIDLLLKGIDEGAYRTAEIVKGLQTFARLDENDLKQINIHDGIESTLILLNSNLKKAEIDVIKDFDKQLPQTECYPGKLNQVFMNVINNAIHAIIDRKDSSKKGVITIKTRTNNNHVIISIEDNGIGISGKNKDKIFEPFFTTKQVGEGTGLGLSIVYNIMKSHNGDIQVESEEGKGTTFILTLPITQKDFKKKG
ncbi:MAG: GHKL domain-containing protein [Bacteroidetes bacterium]|nr:GHKL domain-containing protein [Bacteroidota bacterium]